MLSVILEAKCAFYLKLSVSSKVDFGNHNSEIEYHFNLSSVGTFGHLRACVFQVN